MPPGAATGCIEPHGTLTVKHQLAISWHEFMGLRGPAPVHMGLLHMWEFEWFKAFHLLRDGRQAPVSPQGDETFDPQVADALIDELQKKPLEEIAGREAPPSDYQPTKLGDRPDLLTWTVWAEGVRQKQIQMLRNMKPREIHARMERREIWKALWQARTRAVALDACRRWSELEDVIAMGFTAFPAHVETNLRDFLSITNSTRFPRSRAADDSRMLYLARGMAGAMVNVSPMTSIERLRNMKHGPGGPFWSNQHQLCGCWRCVGRREEGWKIK